MTTLRNNPIAEALRLVRGNPSAVAAIDAAETEAAKAAAASAKAMADKRAKVDRALDERAAAIAADYTARQAEAIIKASRDLARAQLEREFAVTPVHGAVMSPAPVLLPTAYVEKAMARLIATSPVPWAKHRPAGEVRSAQTRAASEAWAVETGALTADDVAGRVAERQAEHAARRERSIAERKKAAGMPGWTASE